MPGHGLPSPLPQFQLAMQAPARVHVGVNNDLSLAMWDRNLGILMKMLAAWHVMLEFFAF